MAAGMRLVLIHDWLTGMRGGEKCLEVLCRHFPEAKLYTLLHKRGSVSPAIEALHPRTSFLNRLPGVDRYYRFLLPLMPFAAKFRLPACDLVVSFSHAVAKAARRPPGVPHVCYCFTPMRYAWHMREAYFGGGRLGKLKSALLERFLARLRIWDKAVAADVTHFIAISETIRTRIRESYERDSVVIYPPVDTDFYTPANVAREEFYLCVSAFAPYKRLDLAMEACRKLGRKLIVIGTGQDAGRLHSLAGNETTFLGRQSDEVIRDHLRRCRALLFPGEEDFGIVPVEAQACGAPVIAFGKGGAVETVRALGGPDEPTGVLFSEQSIDGLCTALLEFERRRGEFDPRVARRNALPFRRQRYEAELLGYLEQVHSSRRRAEPQSTRAA